MSDLSTQLRQYFDATAQPLEVGELVGDEFRVPARAKTPSRKWTAPGWAYGMAAMVVALLLVMGIGLFSLFDSDPEPAAPQIPLLGTWVSTDPDGSNLTMVIEVSEPGTFDMLWQDDYASVCSGAPATMTGTGHLEGGSVLVIPSPVLTCDDGSVPQALSGPPLEEQLQNLTFVHDPGTDTLTEPGIWVREGAEVPLPTATGWWPQSNLEEVEEAQRLADAGDPDYTWQVDPELDGDAAPWGAEIWRRCLRRRHVHPLCARGDKPPEPPVRGCTP
jgi:hypothetical protein